MLRQKNDPYAIKAAFFDAQAREAWAVKNSDPDEMKKFDRLFAVTGPLAGLRVLEPGCGIGRLTERLVAEVGRLGYIVAVDISPRMVAHARINLSDYEKVEIHLGPVEEIIGFENYFDVVICHQVFPHFEDQENALTKISNMLKPGGRIVISNFISSAEIKKMHSRAGSAVANDLMPPPQTMQTMIEQCGFEIEYWADDSDGYLLKANLI